MMMMLISKTAAVITTTTTTTNTIPYRVIRMKIIISSWEVLAVVAVIVAALVSLPGQGAMTVVV